MADPGDLLALDDIEFAAGTRVRAVLGSIEDIHRILGLPQEKPTLEREAPAMRATATDLPAAIEFRPDQGCEAESGWFYPVADTRYY